MALTPTDKAVTATDWVQLTNANVTDLTFQNIGPGTVMLKGTTGATAPTDDTGALRYAPMTGEITLALADAWPGISAVRVYAKAVFPGRTTVSVSHA